MKVRSVYTLKMKCPRLSVTQREADGYEGGERVQMHSL